MQFRIGQGFDVHALVLGRPLIIGGVHLKYEYGLQGHSDADVLLHALIDALLGALGLGDIGQHFPDTDPAYQGADSRLLLREVVSKITQLGWKIVNMDSTIHAQEPKIAPYIQAMKANIAQDLGIEEGQVNIKGKTNEKLGYLGRKEGIASQVVVLLCKETI